MDEEKYIRIFRSEIEGHVGAISEALKALQGDPGRRESAKAIMQRLHSIKGIAGTMGYASLSKLSHSTEDFIDLFVKNKTPLDNPSIKLLYSVLDAVEKFKSALPELKNDLLLDITKVVWRATEGEEIGKTVSDENLDENLSSSIHEMLHSIDTNIKINVKTIDNLLADIGELKNTLAALKVLNEEKVSYRLKVLIKSMESQLKILYGTLINLKMQPFDIIISQLERAINEYCLATDKEIKFAVNTNGILIDSSVLKFLISPLIHLIRNAIDHGIESVDERKKSGKSAKGSVRLTVNKIHDFAEIIIQDDGRGIYADKVIDKAIAKGYIKERPEAVDGDLLLFILSRSGFTTRESVSLVSGRGIGLDVVRSSLENIGGSVSLETKEGKGSKIILKVPVTTAIIRTLIVKSAKHTVAIPSSKIEKIILTKNDAFLTDEKDKSMSYIYMGEKIRVYPLWKLLNGRGNNNGDAAEPDRSGEQSLLIMRIRNDKAAVLVDELISEEELFIKPLTKPLKKMSSFLGYSLLGDGAPVFVLDINSL